VTAVCLAVAVVWWIHVSTLVTCQRGYSLATELASCSRSSCARSQPLPKTNQDRIVSPETLMISDPSLCHAKDRAPINSDHQMNSFERAICAADCSA
jgi:hypothetical protein